MTKFKFDLKQEVELKVSGEAGTVVGRAEYVGDTPSYRVSYKAADGRAVTAWWNAEELKAIKKEVKKPVVKRSVTNK